MISALVGDRLPLWTPEEAVARAALEARLGGQLREWGYRQVYTPHIEATAEGGVCARGSPLAIRGPGAEVVHLRRAPCRAHTAIFAAARRSYRELPLRLFEVADCYGRARDGWIESRTGVWFHSFALAEQLAAERARSQSIDVGLPMSQCATDDGLVAVGPAGTEVPVVVVHGRVIFPAPGG